MPTRNGRRGDVRGFLARHRRVFLIAAAIYVLVIALLLLLSSGPQNDPFLYQIN